MTRIGSSLLALGLLVPAIAQAQIPEAEFQTLHRKLQPPKNELWRSIPWEISILEACQRAEQERKPLLMWVMNGNPCGAV